MQPAGLQHMSCELSAHAAGLPVVIPEQVPTAVTHAAAPASEDESQIFPVGHCESLVHGPHWFVVVLQTDPTALPAQSASTQQLPATHKFEQQSSLVSCGHGALLPVTLLVHAPLAHRLDALQMVPAPYVGSASHCASLEHPPQWLAEDPPQICPAVGQSASSVQSPGTHAPAALHT
jgi:hypothetical protein